MNVDCQEVAWYFAWMGFYTRALMLPAFVGVFVFVLSIVKPETPTLALYAPLTPLCPAQNCVFLLGAVVAVVQILDIHLHVDDGVSSGSTLCSRRCLLPLAHAESMCSCALLSRNSNH